jgi:hypothetical protein
MLKSVAVLKNGGKARTRYSENSGRPQEGGKTRRRYAKTCGRPQKWG